MISHAFSNIVADLTGTVTIWAGLTTATFAASDMVLPSHWNSAHIGVSTFAGNTVGASSWSGTNLQLAAVSNLSLSYAANGLSIVGPDLSPYLTTAQAPGAYLTTAALSNHSHGNPTLALTNLSGTTASNSAGLTLSLSAAAGGGGADGGVFLSAAGSSQSAGNLVLSNSNGVSFGMNGSTITATVATNYQSQGAYLTTAALSNHNHDAAYASINHSHGNPTLALTNASGTTASNSAGLTLSLSIGNYLTTAALSNHNHDAQYATINHDHAGVYQPVGAYLTTAALSNHSHGNPTLALTNISGTTASNSAGLTLSLSAAAPGGGGAGNTISYFENSPIFSVGSIFQANGSSYIGPFVLPADISADYFRFMVQMTTNTSSIGSTANTTFSYQQASTWNAGVYRQMTGASSLSLEAVASASVAWTFQASLQANANGSEYTVTNNVTFPIAGGTSNYSSSYASTQTRFDFSSQLFTLFTGDRFIDIPFASTLEASNYWMAVGMSQAVTTGGVAGATNARPFANNLWAVTNRNAAIAPLGTAFNNSLGLKPGLGAFSSNAAVVPASLELSRITTQGGQVFPAFQMISQG